MEDWNRLAQTPAGQALLRTEWPTLSARPAPPELDLALFPPRLRAMMAAVAASTRAPVELAAVCALGVSSACAVGRVGLRLSPDWVEPGQLFLMGIAPPTSGKSPVFSQMLSPLMAIFDDQQKRQAVQNARQYALRETIEAQATTAKKKGNRDEAMRLAEELASIPPVDEGQRYFSGDVTPEHLIQLMARNGGRLAQLDDEGQLLDMACGRFSDLPDLSPWLKGYTGGQNLQVGRKNGSFVAENASLSVLTLTQPDVLDQVLSSGRLQGKGFLSRFLIVEAPAPKSWSQSVPIPQEVRSAYQEDVQRMAGLSKVTLSLTPEASELWQGWEQACFELQTNGPWRALAAMNFKLNGLPARLAVNLALWEGNIFRVDGQQMQTAIGLAYWAIAHMLARFGDSDALSREAAAALDVVQLIGKSPVRERDVWNRMRRRSVFVGKNKASGEDALRELCERGYLRPCLTPPDGGKWLDVHPKLMEGGGGA